MIDNRHIVTIHFSPLPFDIEIALFLVIILSFIAGILFGFLALSGNLLKKMMTNFNNNRKIRRLEAEASKQKNRK